MSIFLTAGCSGDEPTSSPKGSRIVALNGLYYKADSLAQKPLVFAVADKDDNYIPNQQFTLRLLEGDGALSDSVIVTNSTGRASFSYAFTGSLGHAVVRLVVPQLDSIEIQVRRNILIPGPSGQGQYVLFDDAYATVKKFIGPPASVDVFPRPDQFVIYANYERALGVVVLLGDLDQNRIAYDTSSVFGLIVNTNEFTTYTGTTAEGIGVGSSISDSRIVYGPPDIVRYDSASTPTSGDSAVYFEYTKRGMGFYGDFSPDTIVFEIHMTEFVEAAARRDAYSDSLLPNDNPVRYRRFRSP
ncbi:MAG TPA: hypothetical protein VN285_06295 [Candidatus Deferrimicrobium sp.]|nr:hypothetical protein [Candidatus Deferrimicrobium sp.]